MVASPQRDKNVLRVPTLFHDFHHSLPEELGMFDVVVANGCYLLANCIENTVLLDALAPYPKDRLSPLE